VSSQLSLTPESTAGEAVLGVPTPTEGPVVTFLEPSDWKVLRSVRVRALASNPRELHPKFPAEHKASPDQWRQLLRSATWVVVTPKGGDQAVGMACLFFVAEEGKWYVSSVWTDPKYRRRGYVRAMIDRLVKYAMDAQAQDLHLWVFETNDRAIDAYRKLDFAETGERKKFRIGRLGKYEIQMRLELA